MFCPQCSQAQADPGLKFCSRCGFPLHGVKELMANGGDPISRSERDRQRQLAARGMRQGMFIMITCVMIGAVLSVLGREFGFSRLPGELIAIVGFLLGVLRLLSASMFPPSRLPSSPSDQLPPRDAASFNSARMDPALSGPSTMPIGVNEFVQREPLVPVASVTDHTTQLLDQS